MPRFSPHPQLLALVLSACSGLAAAQQPVTAQPPPSGQPASGLQRIEPTQPPSSNIPTAPGREGTQIKETRGAGGVVTEAEVTTPGGSHYYMKPNGTPQWKVGTFDLSGKRRATSEAGTNAPTAADVPPPPPMSATAAPGTR